MSKAVVLFVDDDVNVIEGLKRMVKVLTPDWDACYSTSGVEGLVLMTTTKVDVVVADQSMPGMSGLEMLRRVQSIYPNVVRIILSSETDNESEEILRATQTVHQFLIKPCKSEILQAIITRALRLRSLLRNPELQQVISGIPYLPSLPPIFSELMRAIESDASLNQIGAIVAKDVSMTSRVLHLVNSAFFGLPRKIANPQEAVVYLGIDLLKALVLFVKLFFTSEDSPIPGMSLDDLWKHSSLTGNLAKDIVAAEGGSKIDQDNAMVAGMMHDIGFLLIMDVRGYIPKVLTEMGENGNFTEAEYSRFSASHAEIGGYLLGIWGLPDLLVEAVACHHRPRQLPQTAFSTLTAVHAANSLLSKGQAFAQPIDHEYLYAIGCNRKLPAWERLAAPYLKKMSTP